MGNKANVSNPTLTNPTLRFNISSDGTKRWELRRSGGSSDTLSFVYVVNNSAKEFFSVGGPSGSYGAYYHEIPFTKSNAVINGSVWITAYEKIAVVTVMCQVKSGLSTWSSYSLGDLTSSKWSYNGYGCCMDQDNGVSHVLGCQQGKTTLTLDIKGETTPSNHWIWGQVVAIIENK